MLYALNNIRMMLDSNKYLSNPECREPYKQAVGSAVHGKVVALVGSTEGVVVGLTNRSTRFQVVSIDNPSRPEMEV